MSNDAPATRGDFTALAAEFRVGFESLAAALTKSVEAMQPAGQVQQVNIPQQEPARADRPMWIMAALVLMMGFVTAVAVVVAMFQGQRVTDLRTDMQAERARSDAHAAWAREESQIVRGYIWKGTVPRLNAYPNLTPEQKK